MARWPFGKRRQKKTPVRVHTRALRIEALEQRALLSVGSVPIGWPGGTPPVSQAWFQRLAPASTLPDDGTPASTPTTGNAANASPLSTSPSASSSTPTVVTSPYQSYGWIVQLTPTAAKEAGSVSGVAAVLGSAGTLVQVDWGLGMEGLVLVTPQAGVTPSAAKNGLVANPNVQWCEPNATVTAAQTPNDPDFGLQWDMLNSGQTVCGVAGTAGADIKATAAWDITTGSPNVVVAVIDSGVDYDHPDLYDNIWINQAEIPASRRSNLPSGPVTFAELNDPANQGAFKITDVNDDGYIDAGDILAPMHTDGNGNDLGGGGWRCGSTQDGNTNFPDDLIGWNFVTNTNDPMDDYGHGTHVAGIIAAEGDSGVGIAGVDWSASIMPLVFINSGGWGWLSDAVSAIDYATMMRVDLGVNVRVTNNSWGGGGYYQSLYDAIEASGQAGILFACAAGNYASDNDTSPMYPASYHLDNMLVVAATDNNDSLASFSNYGAATVDLAAPGVNVPSTWPYGYWGVDDDYAYKSGTSMAAPHVTGVAALAWSIDPDATVAEVRSAILAGVDPLPSLAGMVASGGRLDAAARSSNWGCTSPPARRRKTALWLRRRPILPSNSPIPVTRQRSWHRTSRSTGIPPIR